MIIFKEVMGFWAKITTAQKKSREKRGKKERK